MTDNDSDTETDDATLLEQRAYRDFETIDCVAESGIDSATNGDLDRAQEALETIRDKAQPWTTPGDQ